MKVDNSRNKRFAFVHIPKTGGTYFNSHVVQQNPNFDYLGHSFLESYPTWENTSSKHIKLGRNARPTWTSTYSIKLDIEYVSIIRNPFSLLHSIFYTDFSKHKSTHKEGVAVRRGWGSAADLHGYNFSDFVDDYIDQKKWFFYPGFRKSLFQQIKKPNGDLVASHILRFENLNKNVDVFCRRNNMSRRIDLADTSSRNESSLPWWEMYTADQVKSLSKIWQDDLDRFGYRFSNEGR